MYPQLTRWCQLRMALAAAADLVPAAGPARPDDQAKQETFTLSRGQFTQLLFIPKKPCRIHATAEWEGAASDSVPLKMQLIRPDGSVAADAIGCSALCLRFTLRRREFARNAGKTYRIVLRHAVTGQSDDAIRGELRLILVD